MKKIPTIFERDWEGDRSRVLNQPVEGCEWVFDVQGVATRKYDGTAVLVEAGQLFKRHEVREGKQEPEGFREVEDDLKTGKRVGWVPVGDGPEDKWHRDALARNPGVLDWDGTYELVGPKIQGNPEGFVEHAFVRHTDAEILSVDRTFEGIKEFLEREGIEGIVFHHDDGRMAKIKARDFGIKRKSAA